MREWRLLVGLLVLVAVLGPAAQIRAGGEPLADRSTRTRGDAVQLQGDIEEGLQDAIAAAQDAQNGETDESVAGVVLPRGDAGRSGAMPGPGPTSQPDELWRFDAAASTLQVPVIAGDTIYVATRNGGLFAVDRETGEERWRVDFEDEATVFTPAITDQLVIVSVWESEAPVLVAVERETGEEVWQQELPGNPAEPVVVDGVLYIAAESGFGGEPAGLYALDPATGDEIWAREIPDAHSLSGAVAVAGGMVFTTVYGDPGVGLYAIDAATGEERWVFTGAADVVADPVVSDGVVVVADVPAVWGLDAETGEELWQVRGSDVGGGVAVVDGVAYLSFKEEVRAVDAQSGEELWSADVAGVPGASAVADGIVYLAAWRGSDEEGENHWVYALDATTGEEVWSLETELMLSASMPIVLDGVIYLDVSFERVGYVIALGDST